MSLKQLSINVDATSVSPTGGTATPVIIKQQDFSNVVAILANGSNLKDQTVLKFVARDPKANDAGANGYSQARTAVNLIRPKVLSNNALTHNTAGFTLSFDIETTAAEVDDMLYSMAQIICSADARDFFKSQVTA